MTMPALSDEILLQIEKPARYTGNEKNSVVKDASSVRIRFAMCFPDVYEIGMSHLGIQIIYEQLNRRADTWCERVYSPWPDLEALMRRDSIPLFMLESQEPVRNADFLGITLQYELCYTNVLQVLELSHIPLHADERGEDDPIVMGGGPCTYNPEPIATFFDLFYIGESEAVMDRLMDLYGQMKAAGAKRASFIREAAKIPGIYAPSLYEVGYNEDGTIAYFEPICDDIPKTVKRVLCDDLEDAPYPENPVVPFIRATQDRVVLEIQRGCIRGCRFCQAGMVYRPLRERPLEVLKKYAGHMLGSSGYEEISLSSLSSSDYSCLPELLTHLIDSYREDHVNISLPSLRIDNFSLDVMSKVQDVRKSSLTFAPEAGTQRLRDVINKGITEEDILVGASQAFHGGWTKVKLYFMLGLPTETDEDRKGIAHLAQSICEVFYDEIPKEERNGVVDIVVSSSFFVPKPFTPFQWAQMARPSDYVARAHTVRDEIRQMKNQKRIHYKWHEPDGTELEGVLARGDRRVADVIEAAYRRGAVFDSWSDFFRYDRWKAAYEDAGVDPEFYTLRYRGEDEILPWDFIDIGVSRSFLWKEWQKAVGSGEVTPNCRDTCSGCGAARFRCGVCLEEKTAGAGKRQ
ncbi:MAG: TIGR03960 family B12-binding radical SAM protein [Lachnospiraceae bacterium]|nr:TIGR03960 family B12-binding radical SAM protein [Lachnospiraceae bacterium]